MKIGLGLYPAGKASDIISVRPNIALVMDSHDAARQLKAQRIVTIRRAWQPDNSQINFSSSPLENATHWRDLILGGLNPTDFKQIYDYTVGWNELYDNNNKALFKFLAQCEIALCNLLQSYGMKYAWGSIAVGNVDPIDFVSTFAKINSIADAVNYHGYLAPDNIYPAKDDEFYLKRPRAWWEACKEASVRFSPLLLGESGTYTSWKTRLDAWGYTKLLGQISDELENWHAQGMPVLGHCAFAVGAQEDMGKQWNIDDLNYITKYNIAQESRRIIDLSGIGAWIWYARFDPNFPTDVRNTPCTWIIVKYSDGSSYGSLTEPTIFRDQFNLVAPALRAMGYKVGAYAYIYLDDPEGEARAIATANADFLVLDIEYEAISKLDQAQTFFNTLKSLTNKTLCFNPDLRILVGNAPAPWTDRDINLIAEPWPWETCLANCDYIMPQLYYTDFNLTPDETMQLVKVLIDAESEYKWKADTIMPVFPANSSAADLQKAISLCTQMDINGVSMWRYDDTSVELWNVLRGFVNDDTLKQIGEQIFFVGAGVPFNPDAALTKAWFKAFKDGNYLGRPRGLEFDAGPYRCQEFERNIAWALRSDYSKFGYGFIS